jgi:argininosuccinate lyase
MSGSVWQKRFKKRVNSEVLNFSSSINDDYKLIPYDIFANIAHAEMLYHTGYISKQDLKKIIKGLKSILNSYAKGEYELKSELEDVHMNIEDSLRKLIGSVADKLHTARSRNDLIALELKLYSIDCLHKIIDLIDKIQNEIVVKSERESNYVIPGYTHLQRAQPILWSFYLLSFFFKLERDYQNLNSLNEKLMVSPLGAAALAGSSLRIDPVYTTMKLKMSKFYENAMDAVTDRDFLLEMMFYATQIMVHLSTFAEDMIIYSTQEFSLIELDDTIATGSSIMPQKKNPDLFELLRAKTAKFISNLNASFVILKSLPSAYNKDLQELKSIYISQIDELIKCLNILLIALPGIKIKESKWAESPDFSCATDICDLLISRGYAFREAYNLVAECVEKSGGDIDKFISLCIDKVKIAKEDLLNLLKPINSIKNKKSIGSTSPDAVRLMLSTAKEALANRKRKEI